MPYLVLRKQDAGSYTCQKCLKKGHFTYECTGKRKYVYRASRTKTLKKQKLEPTQVIAAAKKENVTKKKATKYVEKFIFGLKISTYYAVSINQPCVYSIFSFPLSFSLRSRSKSTSDADTSSDEASTSSESSDDDSSSESSSDESTNSESSESADDSSDSSDFSDTSADSSDSSST